MSTTNLAQLLAEEMRQKGLSTRDVARDADVAHTTIARILRNRPVSVKTLQNVARYLNADPGIFIGAEGDVAQDIATLIGKEPALAGILGEAVKKVQRSEIPPDTLREIVRYAAWRINESSIDNTEGPGGA